MHNLFRRLWRRRKRRSGLTTVEYALMLFFFAITAIFGFPTLASTAKRYVSEASNSFDDVSNVD